MTEVKICKFCKKPWTAEHHSLARFRPDGCPQTKCSPDVPMDPRALFDGINILWDRTVAAENGGALAKKTSDLSEALTTITRLELSEKQLKAKIAKHAEEAAKAVEDALRAIKDEMKAKLDEARGKAEQSDKDGKAALAKIEAQLTFTDNRLREAEADVAALRAKNDELTANLTAELDRARNAEARAKAAEARVAAPLEQAFVGEFSALCQRFGIPLTDKVALKEIEIVDEKPADADAVVDFDQRTGPTDVQKMFEPAPDTAATAATPAAPAADPTPAIAQTGLACMYCDEPASKIIKLELRVGDHLEFLSCMNIRTHEAQILDDVKEYREHLKNPPDDSSKILDAAEDITPNPTV